MVLKGLVCIFLSTPSARRATPVEGKEKVFRKISIHALREEGDPPVEPKSLIHFYFYPRPPRGGRHMDDVTIYAAAKFLSTPSARRATRISPPAPPSSRNFYPRPPRGGRRDRQGKDDPDDGNFYPRPPRGGRLVFPEHLVDEGQFLSTPSARRATGKHSISVFFMVISIHALREEGDDSPKQRRLTP